MPQPAEERALYLRELRRTVRTLFVPELTSAQALDAAGLVDRILVQMIVDAEASEALGAELAACPEGSPGRSPSEVRERAAVERQLFEHIDQLRNALLTPEEADAASSAIDVCSVAPEQLTDYLRRRLARSPQVAVERLTLVPGGRSKETVLVALHGTDELPAEVILRKDRPVGLLKTRAADEFALIRAVHEYGGVPVPEPFWADTDAPEIGDGTFLVMERVRGRKAGEFFPDLAAPAEHREEIGAQLARALARLHSLPLERLAGTGVDPGGSPVTAESTTATVEAIGRRIDELSGPPSATVELARRWLLDHACDVADPPRLALLQGDFGLHNTLVDEGRVTALVDWEGASIGPPARELAAASSAASFLMGWPTFLEAYVDAGGHREDADPRAVNYYRVLTCVAGYMTSRMGGHLFRTGAKRDLLTGHSGLDSNFRSVRNLARVLAEAMEE